MKIVISSGVISVKSLGAVRSVDISLVEALRSLGHDVVWFGVDVKQFGGIEIPALQAKLVFRVINRVLSFLPGELDVKLRFWDTKRYSKLLASKLEKLLLGESQVDLFIGRSLFSLDAINVCKRFNVLTVLHSQWQHPDNQSNALRKAFLSEGVNNPKQIYPLEKKHRILEEFSAVDRIWTFSELGANSFGGTPFADKTFIAPLGVDLNTYKYEGQIFNSRENLEILFVGNINPEKGVGRIFNVLSKLSPNKTKRFSLLGAVPRYYKNIFDSRCDELRRMNWKVRHTVAEPSSWYKNSDILILMSWHESFGLVVLEAMASGVIVVVSREIGAATYLTDGVNALIVDSENDAIQGIERLISSPDTAQNIQQNAVELSQQFSWRIVSQNLLEQICTSH